MEQQLCQLCSSVSLSEEVLRQIDLSPHNNSFNHVRNYQFFHAACNNERVNEGIIGYLLHYFPDAPRTVDRHGETPLHLLCHNTGVDEAPALAILKLLIKKYPHAVRHAANDGSLPIHFAAATKSLPFCSMLIQAYPESAKKSNGNGALPFHLACVGVNSTLETVKYFYRLYPSAITHESTGGHCAIHGVIEASNPEAAVSIFQFLLSCSPHQEQLLFKGKTLLHFACQSKYNDSNIDAAIQIIKVILEVSQRSVRAKSYDGHIPLHALCMNRQIDEAASIRIMKMLLKELPNAVFHQDNYGCLPIHLASEFKTVNFCSLLIEAYPDSVKIPDGDGRLPFHHACYSNDTAVVKFLHKKHPDAVNTRAGDCYPIHDALDNMIPAAAVRIVQFLLDCDPIVKMQKYQDKSLLLYICEGASSMDNDSDIDLSMRMVKSIYDAQPEAIESNTILREVEDFRDEVRSFVNGELVYARQAKDRRLMMTRDDNGQLPLHRALQANVRLGSIKLLVAGYPPTLQNGDNSGALPLHIACMHHDTVSVIQYLVELDQSTLDAVDRNGNTALHYACRAAKYDTIALLLEKYDAVSVSKRNVEDKLPIELLWETDALLHRESIEYTGSVFQLLKAYPETVTNVSISTNQQSTPGERSSQNCKKRKHREERDSNESRT